MNARIMEKVNLVWTLWCLMSLARHVFVTEDLGLQILWLFITVLSGATWGYWCGES